MTKQWSLEQIQREFQELDVLEIQEKDKLQRLQKAAEILDALDDQETRKLKKLQQKKNETAKNQQEKTHEPKTILASKIAKRGLLTTLVLNSPSIGQSETHSQNKENDTNKITKVEERKTAETNKSKTIEINQENKKPAITPTANGETKLSTPTPRHTATIINTANDDVFEIIETIQIDPKDNTNINDRYTNRNNLSETDKNTVKKTYTTITTTKEKSEIQTMIRQLDKKIMMGLYDICVKKSFILKKEGKQKELEKMRTITQLIVERQNEMINEWNILP